MSKRANGEGTIYQRKDGRYEAAAYVLQADGVYKRQRVYGKRREEVAKKLAELVTRSNAGVPAEATGWSVERFLTYWVDHIRRSSKPKTVQGYEVVVRVHLVPGLGKKRLHKLTAADVRLFFQRFENSCLCCRHGWDERRKDDDRRCCAIGKCCESTPSPRLVQQVHAVLRNALQAAVREELIQRNVARLVQIKAPAYEVNRGLTADQARKLLITAESDRFHALYVLALYLGLRRGELLGLRWEDVNSKPCPDCETADQEPCSACGGLGTVPAAIEVRRTLQRVAGKLQAVTPKTRTSGRTIPLVGVCADALRTQRVRQQREREAAGADWQDTGYVFTTVIGTPVEPDNLRRSWYRIREAADLAGVRLHDLRHSCVTLLLNLGAPPHVVRSIAGHSDIEVTMTIYAHVSLDEMRTALSRLDDHLR